MKTNNLHYIKANIKQASVVIEIENLQDFCHYAEKHALKEVFLIENASKFALLSHQAILNFPTNGYKTLEDAQKAAANAFESSKDYYSALEMGIANYDDYDLILKCGTTDKDIYSQLQKEGYIDGYKKYKQYLQENENPNEDIPLFSNTLELYNFASKSLSAHFEDFFLAFQAGFGAYGDYVIANERGFTNAKDYFYALENGFQNNETYQMALQHNIINYTQLMQKINLEISYPDLTHEQSLVLFLLSKLEQGKKVSVNKLDSLLKLALEEYLDAQTKELFPWFKKSFEAINDLSLFLQSNIDVKKFGSYDSDGEFFEINNIKDRSIVIDGSNIAHNSANGRAEKPLVANLLTMVKYLKTKGFTDILIISDASLKHKLGDTELLEELKKEAKYEIAPAETSADSFIISYVKEKHCLLLSNDTFKQYKITDTWTALNIDYYRLTFMITDGEVFMPDLK